MFVMKINQSFKSSQEFISETLLVQGHTARQELELMGTCDACQGTLEYTSTPPAAPGSRAAPAQTRI